MEAGAYSLTNNGTITGTYVSFVKPSSGTGLLTYVPSKTSIDKVSFARCGVFHRGESLLMVYSSFQNANTTTAITGKAGVVTVYTSQIRQVKYGLSASTVGAIFYGDTTFTSIATSNTLEADSGQVEAL
jgi:hypothetical protein